MGFFRYRRETRNGLRKKDELPAGCRADLCNVTRNARKIVDAETVSSGYDFAFTIGTKLSIVTSGPNMRFAEAALRQRPKDST